MKRDLTNSRTYLPPRVRVVEMYHEEAILVDSKVNLNSKFSVDELYNANADENCEETFYFPNL